MEQLSPNWSVVAYAGVLFGAILVQRLTGGRQEDRFKSAFTGVRAFVLAFCAAALVLWFSLPSTPALATFGYPDTVSDLEAPGSMLRLLQDYNRAIVRTTEVVHWFLFLFVFGLVAPLTALLTPLLQSRDQAVRKDKDHETLVGNS